MQAYLNQQFPLGPGDLSLHPAGVADAPTDLPDEATEEWTLPTCRLGYWRIALSLLG
jgi:hypothetical protein